MMKKVEKFYFYYFQVETSSRDWARKASVLLQKNVPDTRQMELNEQKRKLNRHVCPMSRPDSQFRWKSRTASSSEHQSHYYKN